VDHINMGQSHRKIRATFVAKVDRYFYVM